MSIYAYCILFAQLTLWIEKYGSSIIDLEQQLANVERDLKKTIHSKKTHFSMHKWLKLSVRKSWNA